MSGIVYNVSSFSRLGANGDLLTSEASQLQIPPGVVLSSFAVEGLGKPMIFNYSGVNRVHGEVAGWEYSHAEHTRIRALIIND